MLNVFSASISNYLLIVTSNCVTYLPNLSINYLFLSATSPKFGHTLSLNCIFISYACFPTASLSIGTLICFAVKLKLISLAIIAHNVHRLSIFYALSIFSSKFINLASWLFSGCSKEQPKQSLFLNHFFQHIHH